MRAFLYQSASSLFFACAMAAVAILALPSIAHAGDPDVYCAVISGVNPDGTPKAPTCEQKGEPCTSPQTCGTYTMQKTVNGQLETFTFCGCHN